MLACGFCLVLWYGFNLKHVFLFGVSLLLFFGGGGGGSG